MVQAPAWVAQHPAPVRRALVAQVVPVAQVRARVAPVDLVVPVAQVHAQAQVAPVAVVDLVVPVGARVVRVAQAAAPVVLAVVPAPVAAAQPLAHSVSPEVSRVRAARASARSVKSGTTCKRRCSVCRFRAETDKQFGCHAVHR